MRLRTRPPLLTYLLFRGLEMENQGSVAKMRNAEHGAVLDGDGTTFFKVWGINGPWSPACTTGIALDEGQVYEVWKSGRAEH